MAQGRVTEYFNVRKRGSNLQPSKRRKLQNATEIDFASAVFDNNEKISQVEPSEAEERKTQTTTSTRKSVPKNTRSTVRQRSKVNRDAKLMATLFNKTPTKTTTVPALEEPTSLIDNHAPPSTPQRQSTNECNVERKRKREVRITQQDKLDVFEIKTPEKGYEFKDFNKTKKQKSIRKKLILKPVNNTETESTETEIATGKNESLCLKLRLSASPTLKPTFNEGSEEDTQSKLTDNTTKPLLHETVDSHSTTPLMNRVKSVLQQPKDNVKGNKDGDEVKQRGEEGKASLDKPNKMVKVKSTKPDLTKCGNLAELQSRLAAFNKSAAKLKSNREKQAQLEKAKEKEMKEKALEKEKKVPAYEKFHSLAKPSPPTLSLPFKYKVLAEMFRSTDTVVSMLHNRAEVCTYSKLKSAVQEMMRKNFELSHLSQIKSVHPTAYTFRQETGLPQYGGKTASYQLTVEPQLPDLGDGDNVGKTLNAKVKRPMLATAIVDRRNTFHTNLVDIVKHHHKKFLEKLDHPLTVPDDKITRWHPKFPLDQVPDIVSSDLPKAPYVAKASSASAVLKQNREKFPVKMQEALENIANNTPDKDIEKVVLKSKNNNQSSAIKTENPSKVKGISSTLLERIRAKEAKKIEENMTRDPVKDKKIERIGRLPEIARILRAYFVKQKKPTLTMTDGKQILMDSYHSNIAPGEIEDHIKLLSELCPEFMTIMKVRQGQYLKINKNMDITALTESLASQEKL